MQKKTACRWKIPKAREIAFARRLVQPVAAREELLGVLKERLRDQGFFGKLRNSGGCFCVKRFKWKGFDVAIKDTTGRWWHGYQFNTVRRTVLRHHMALRQGLITTKRYVLGIPKVYGRIGDYLIMEFVDSSGFRALSKKQAIREDYNATVEELRKNLGFLKGKLLIGRIPQLAGLFCAGNTNPREPTKGKWLFFLPYDYI